MRIGLAIDQTTNDLFFRSDGSLAVVTEAEAVAQHVRDRLKAFYGEWFLDTTVGTPWLQQVLGFNYNPELAESVVKATILGTDGVTSIEAFSISFDRSTRGVHIRDVIVLTDYDQRVSV